MLRDAGRVARLAVGAAVLALAVAAGPAASALAAPAGEHAASALAPPAGPAASALTVPAGPTASALAAPAAPAASVATPSPTPTTPADGGDTTCSAATRITEAPLALGVLQSDLAWETTRGAGVLVAVVDSGVAAVPHLAGALAGGIDLVGDGKGPFTDLEGHGTAVAGEIAARRLDGSGIVGLAPEATILSVRVFATTSDQDRQAGFGPDTGKLVAGIRAAVDAGARIVNVSLTTSVPSDELAAAVAYAAERGSLVVASGGNRDKTQSFDENQSDGERYPAGDAGAVGVAATDTSGVVGDASIHGPHIALAAPGQQVRTVSVDGGDCAYAQDPSSSFAAAYVSASAALVAAAHPGETPAQWAYRLEASAVRADPDRRDDVSGWGVVQPADAISLVPGSGVRGPTSPFGEDAGTPAPTGTPTPIAIVVGPPANADAVALALGGAVAAAVVLGVLGTIAVMLRRRAAPPAAPVRRGRGGGLFGTDPTQPIDDEG